jgi:VWFA-related protein
LAVVGLAQQPQFKTGVERIVVDVEVVDNQGRPISSLTADDFEVRFDQGIRKVATVQFIRDAALDTAAAGAPAPGARPEQQADATPSASRDFILAVDESSFHTRYAPAAVRAARGFIERLSPADRVGLYLYPVSKRSFVMTTDHQAVLKELDGVVGTLDLPISEFHLAHSEVIDISAGDADALARVAARACSRNDTTCRNRIKGEANTMAMVYESQVSASMGGLRTLFGALRQDPERKTVVVLSGGLLASDRPGGRPDVSGVVTTLGELAARSNTTLYVLHMDSSFLEAFSAANSTGAPASLMRDQGVSEGGLDRLAGTAGGTLVRVEPGGEDRAFQRILRETSAHYLLGVEPLDRDRDGRPHYISVKVRIHGAEVRSRRTVVIPVKG